MKKKKHLKIFAASSLALIMSAGVLCGVLVPVGALVKETINQNTSISPLGMDPENDPVVFTTDYGLEIKYANAEMTNTNLAGYTYFTMGKYNGYDVNWVIIGYDPSLSDFVGNFACKFDVFKYSYVIENNHSILDTIDPSSAGQAIFNDIAFISSEAIEDDDIGIGCVLCLSQKNIFTTYFRSSGSNCYVGSNLEKEMSTLSTTLNLNDLQISKIQLQEFTSKYTIAGNGHSEDPSINQSFFPLAAQGEKFTYSTYLLNENKRISYALDGSSEPEGWWLRSGYAWSVYSAGAISNQGVFYELNNRTTNNLGVRPAFVLKLI